MVFCPEHPKRDQNLKFTPLSETTSIPAPFIWEFPPPPGITVSVCYVSWSKVNRRERSRPSLFVCFVFHLAKYISLRAFGSVVSVSCLESKTSLGRL